jgi:tetratricopeptide (TPR) repeat protein
MKKRKDHRLLASFHVRVDSCHSLLIVFFACLALVLTLFAILPRRTVRVFASDETAEVVTAAIREDAYRANNLGVALLEQFNHKEGAVAFTRALELDSQLTLARINLSIALYNLPDLEASLREAQRASAAMPDAPQPHYIIGLIAKTQNRTDEAIAAFRRVLELDARDVGANVNLGQLYTQQRNYQDAIAAFRVAVEAEPYNETALYNLALALTRTGERAEGQRLIARFQSLRQSGAGTAIGSKYLEQGHYAEAVASTGAEAELVDKQTPDVTFVDATARVLPVSLNRQTHRARDDLQQRGAPTARGKRQRNASRQRRNVSPRYEDEARSALISSVGVNVTLFDFDKDGDLDVLDLMLDGLRLYGNDAGQLSDVTPSAGALNDRAHEFNTGAIAGDYDNDGREDLFILRYGKCVLYHNDGNGKFSDHTIAAGLPAYPYLSMSAAFVDADHDGDLDIFIAGLLDINQTSLQPMHGADAPSPDGLKGKATGGAPNLSQSMTGAPNMLLRNNGNGTFTDITAAAKVTGSLGHAVAVVPTDYDNRRDVDLLVLNADDAPTLYANQRDRTFRNVAPDVGLNIKGDWTCAAAGDVNKDGFTDFFFGRADGAGLFALSDGKGKFLTQDAPHGTENVSAAQFLDYDNDGLLDCLILKDGSVRVWRNVGDGWKDVSEKAVARNLSGAERGKRRQERDVALPGLGLIIKSGALNHLATGDMDGDGDVDLILHPVGDETLTFARNDGGNRNSSVRVNLFGKVSNRSGIGVKVEARDGSLVQKLETYSATPAPAPSDMIFGLGKRGAPDAVRVLWPAGIVQSETEIVAQDPTSAGGTASSKNVSSFYKLPVTELDRKPSSCPYLYTWNGSRFEFITDFMGGGEMGYLEEPGRYNTPDPDEYVRIRGDQLKERDGRYELRVTNELEEALFFDRLQLIAIAHPKGVEVYPNEGMIDPPLPPFKLYTTHDAHPPPTAFDDHGHDVLSRIAKLDRTWPDDFGLAPIRGYADEHTLTMKLDEKAATQKRTLLLLTGWTDYAWSSDNVAASQSGRAMKLPALQVRDKRGQWRTVIEDIGIPIGRPQTVIVDLTGKFLTSNREVRIVTNMRIYWDQIQVDTSDGLARFAMTRLDPTIADLRWRGFSAEVTPDGREPFGYDYARVAFNSPWKVMAGRYTRAGDVRELLKATDDIFVTSRPGDEISLSFDASALPALPENWTRTFLLYADGFSKEMDINSASPDQLAPLPFHGMKKYPYAAPAAFPMTEERRAFMDRYNTRLVTTQVPMLVNSK